MFTTICESFTTANGLAVFLRGAGMKFCSNCLALSDFSFKKESRSQVLSSSTFVSLSPYRTLKSSACLLECWGDLIFVLASAGGISLHSITTMSLGRKIQLWSWGVPCHSLSPSMGSMEVQGKCDADAVGCTLQRGWCIRIPVLCRASFISQPQAGKRDGKCKERSDAGECWKGDSCQQLNSVLQKRSCKSSNPSVHLVGET